MLCSARMEQPSERNFAALISLLLMGIGAGLIIIPGHFGVTSHGAYTLSHGAVGLICFATALSLQVTTVWSIVRWKAIAIKLAATTLLVSIGVMLLAGKQPIGAIAMITGGLTQLLILIPWISKYKPFDPFHLTIVISTAMTGILLPSMAFDFENASTYIPILATLFLVTAFLAGIFVVVPSIRFGRRLAQLQVVPWLCAGILFFITRFDNLLAPTAIILMLFYERHIPWKRLTAQKEDILSRRVIMIAYFTELANITFLGALLYSTHSNNPVDTVYILSPREASFAFFIFFSAMMYYATTTVIMTTTGLIQELNRTGDPQEDGLPESPEDDTGLWGARLDRYLYPFIMSTEGIRRRVQADQIKTLSHQTEIEKKRNAQLILLLELSQQLENQLDQPVSAQLAVNTLERALNCSLAAIFLNDRESGQFALLASTGRYTNVIPLGFRQEIQNGVLGRALRQRKTQIVNDIRMDPDYLPLTGNEKNLSLVVVPLNFNGHIHGLISLHGEAVQAFGSLEVGLAESVAAELTRAWERSGYHQRLRNLIETGSQLTSAPDPETTARDVASISREIVQAKFTYIYIQLGQDQNHIVQASSGNAPLLHESLISTDASSDLIKLVLHASQPFRIRDARKYERTAHLTLDNAEMRSMLTIPIRWHNVNIGAIFAFGKQKEVFFTENDESLAELISIQAGGALESTWLQRELRASLQITSLLYRLSNQIIQSENIEDAAFDIAQTAQKLGRNIVTGIVLFDQDDSIIAEVQVDEAGRSAESDHPLKLIRDTVKSTQKIYVSSGENILRTCLPIQTPIRSYGAIWMDTFENPARPNVNPDDLQSLVNQAAIALERSLLLVESRQQAKEIKEAYDTLEATYDQTLASLTSALDARDRETEGHSMRVRQLAIKLGVALGYPAEQLKILERGAILHDIGKIGISDNILHKPGPLTEDEWKIMRQHPYIGARIVKGIPFLQETIELIESHQERWDGSGYPLGLAGKDIPELARLFSIIDAFDALTSNRPYRQKILKAEALSYLKEMADIQFDPVMVEAFENLLKENPELLSAFEE